MSPDVHARLCMQLAVNLSPFLTARKVFAWRLLGEWSEVRILVSGWSQEGYAGV